MQSKIKFGKIFLIISVFAFAAVLFSSCDIRYEATDAASGADISLINEHGYLESYDNVPLPNSKSFDITLKRAYEFFYAVISALGKNSGPIRCVVYKGGSAFREE
jgi:hypothetical protein